MRDEVLFEMTKDVLDTGLRGIPVGYCPTSFVDPQKGLSYVGCPIGELAHRDPLEVVYLLYFGEVGTKAEVAKFRDELKKEGDLKEETVQQIASLSQEGDPLDLLAMALGLVGMYEGTGDLRKDCLKAIATLPRIVAILLGDAVRSNTDLSRCFDLTNFVEQIYSPKEDFASLEGAERTFFEVYRLLHILHLDDCGGNLPNFVGKAVASGGQNLYSSLAAAMMAFGGERQGRASRESVRWLDEVLQATKKGISVEQSIRKKVEQGDLIFGFGHSVLRVEDPRATVCYAFCQKHFAEDPLVKIALQVRKEGSVALKEKGKVANPYPNLEAIAGPMLCAAGFPYPKYFGLLFGSALCVGIAIQIVYDRLEAREGKGTSMVHPRMLYRARR